MSLEDDIIAVDNLIQQIQESNVGRIDGTVLSTLLTLIYKCGLQLNEAPEIRIEALHYDDNSELDSITITASTSILIPDEVKSRLKDYVAYLSDKGYPAIPRSLFFPKYNETKKIIRHLKKFSAEIGVMEIHKAGIKRHYDLMIKRKIKHKEALASTALQFRRTARGVEQVIEDKIQPAGRPKPTASTIEQDQLFIHIAKAESLKVSDDQKIMIKEIFEFINNSSYIDEDRNKLKILFIAKIIDSVKYLRKEVNNDELKKNIKYNSFRELLSLIPSEESEGKNVSQILEEYYFPERYENKTLTAAKKAKEEDLDTSADES
jgi:hypothetical protein